MPPKEAKGLASSGDGHTYTLKVSCGFETQSGNCQEVAPQICLGADESGLVYVIYKDGVEYGTVCLGPDDAASFGEVSPGLVLSEFKKLTWPKPELAVQPPGGRTLVNFETIFHTPLGAPQTQTVTLLGQRVTIEASPVEYLWHSDTAGETWSTTDPGRPWQQGDDADQLNHFVYRDAGVTVHPFADVVYAGRFRVGNGQWQDIPQTLTVTGPSQPLRIVEARSVLVAPDG